MQDTDAMRGGCVQGCEHRAEPKISLRRRCRAKGPRYVPAFGNSAALGTLVHALGSQTFTCEHSVSEQIDREYYLLRYQALLGVFLESSLPQPSINTFPLKHHPAVTPMTSKCCNLIKLGG